MTIAIAATFEGGAIVCSDTKVSASDGATSWGSKQFLGVSATGKMYVIADSSEDAYAAKMLGADISSAIADTDKSTRIEPAIKKVMEEWYNAYRYVHAPQVQFILAIIQKDWKNASLYYCEPPNTVAQGSPIAIGKGARAVDPALDILRAVAGEKMDARSALLRAAYLMHLAKSYEGSACGGDSFAAVISAGGGFTFVGDEEMSKAEALAKNLDKSLESGIRKATGSDASILHKFPFPKSFDEVSEQLKGFDFPSLKHLDRKLWRIKK